MSPFYLESTVFIVIQRNDQNNSGKGNITEMKGMLNSRTRNCFVLSYTDDLMFATFLATGPLIRGNNLPGIAV